MAMTMAAKVILWITKLQIRNGNKRQVGDGVVRMKRGGHSDGLESGAHKYFMLVGLCGRRKQKLLNNAPFWSGEILRGRSSSGLPSI